MSRCTVEIKDNKPEAKEVAVGIAAGWLPEYGAGLFWFVQVFGEETADGHETLLADYEGTSRGEVLEILSKYAKLSDPYTRAVYDQVVLDLDPGDLSRLSFVSKEVAEAVTVVSNLEYAVKTDQ